MVFPKSTNLRLKLVLVLLCAGLLPVFSLGYISLQGAIANERQQGLEKLATIRDIRASQVVSLIQTSRANLESLTAQLALLIDSDKLPNVLQQDLLPANGLYPHLQLKVSVTYILGGTSKGIFFNLKYLP